MARHHVILIPGFFGFGQLGNIRYFHHVEEALSAALSERGVEVEVHTVNTLPTGSIPSRVDTLLDKMERDVDGDGPIHLIGHSTGGLDARLFVTPGVSLSAAERRRPFRERTESVVSIATPHYGTPIASTFDGLFGQKLLFAFSLGTIYTLRFGRLPTDVLFRLVGLVSRLDDHLGLRDTLLDQVYGDLLSDFDHVRRREVQDFLHHVVADRSALGQLTPGSIELLNAAAGDAPNVRYGSVVTYTAPPTLGSIREIGFHPYQLASHALFKVLRGLTGRGSAGRPEKFETYADALGTAFGTVPRASDSDGVVPTCSQIWGDLICAVRGDHLDVCGHFAGLGHSPPHVDWMVSGTHFNREDFERVWTEIAEFLVTD